MKQIKKQAKIGMLILVFLIALATPTFAEYPSCCCYSNTVSVVRSDSDYGYCIENGGSIRSGAAQTYQQCVDTCGLNACSNCKAEQCSAYDNCNANPSGGLCASGETCCSGACTMKQGPGQGCENPNLAIKPTNLGRGNDQGYKRVSLSWDNNYVCPASSYDILRCLGASCTPAVSISTTSQKSFVDSGVEWGNTYRYIIKGNYPSQGQKSSEILTVYIGDSTCNGHTNDAAFCVGNERATCSLSNTLTKTTCPSNQICVGGACISSSNCNEDSGNPFGEYYSIFNCEGTSQIYKYCFLDRSQTNVDKCYTCGGGNMKCYDYKSQRACEKDNCRVGTKQNPTSCKWVPTYAELGIGVCVDQEADNCGYCKLKGTTGMTAVNSYAYNDVFDAYSIQRLNALSTEKYPCFDNGNNCVSCGDVGCLIYKTQEECSKLGSNPVSLNGLNEFTSTSSYPSQGNDKCNIGVCRWFSNTCKKDADGLNLADCDGTANAMQCERDYFKPNATILPLTDSEGSTNGFSFTIIDKTNNNESASVRSSNDYKIYYCIAGSGSSCIPRTQNNGFKSTSLRALSIGNSNNILKLCAGVCTNSSISLNNGMNTLKYYAQDPNNNLGIVQSIQFFASMDTRPNPYAYYIENYNHFEDGIDYTNNKNPKIIVNFSFPAKLLNYELKNSNNQNMPITYTNNGFKESHSIQTNNLADGTYTFYFNAENEIQRQMASRKQFSFVVDTIKPTMTIKPVDNSVVTQSSVMINISFNEKSFLDKVIINGQDLTDSFSTTNNLVYKLSITNISEGLYTLNATGTDYAGNEVKGISNFEVNVNPNLIIWMTKPKYGVSPNKTFMIELQTDNTAECRFSIDNNLQDFNQPFKFASTGNLVHSELRTIDDFDQHTLYVKCKDKYHDSITSKNFNISVDITPPAFVEARADPELARTFTILKIKTDDITICNYSSILTSGNFDGYQNNTYSISHTKTIYPLLNDSTYIYRIDCTNLAGLSNQTSITFRVNISAPLTIESKTREYFVNKSLDLAVGINLETDCKYSSNKDLPATSWPNMVNDPTSTGAIQRKAAITVSGNGHYTYYVKCFDIGKNPWIGNLGLTDPFEISFDVDTTSPNMSYVNDSSDEPNPEITWKQDRLRVKWMAYDNETEVTKYHYRLKKFGSTTDFVFNWTIVSDQNEGEWILVDQLNLSNKQKYQFEVKSENRYGLIGNSLLSDGIMVDNSTKPSHCLNNETDGGETDKDCGDGCSGCGIGKICNSTYDCISDLTCVNKRCKNVTNTSNTTNTTNTTIITISCNDQTKDGTESDVDCGGSCPNKCDNGKYCSNSNNNCKSGYCDLSTGKCANVDICHNNRIDPGETEIDCGGPCEPCQNNGFCDTDRDCLTGSKCIGGTCKSDIDGDGKLDSEDNCPNDSNEDQADMDGDGKGDLCDDDIDGDGLTNDFETKYGLDPYSQDTDGNGVGDSYEDPDSDGLTNQEEQDNGPGNCLDSYNSDSDGDGYKDKQEIDAGTDPCDANSHPASKWWIWILLLLILLLILLIFLNRKKIEQYIEKQNKNKTAKPLSPPPLGPTKIFQQHTKPTAILPKDTQLDEIINKKRKEKEQQRKGLFASFGFAQEKAPEKKETEKPKETKFKEEIKPNNEQTTKEEWLQMSSLDKKTKKEDVFGKLKDISKGQKDIFQKLDKINKPKEQTKIVPIIIKNNVPKKILKVVATQTSKIYHKPGCITIRGKNNLTNFNNEEQAKSKNMKRCDVCFPVKNKNYEKKK